MHEMSIAEAMLDLVEETLGARKELASATITLGPLAGISPDALEFCFTEVADFRGFGRPELVVNHVKARARCRSCGTAYELDDFFDVCPNCGNLAREVLSGDEFTLDTVNLADEEDED